MNKQPEVTQATRAKLIASFWKILPEHGLHKVTVSAIVKDAGYNRSTFYEYFTDVYALMHDVEDEMIQSIMSQVANRFSDGLPKNLDQLANESARIFGQLDDKLCYLLSANGDSSFSLRFKQKFLEVMMQYFDFGDKEVYKEYILTFCYSALLGMRLYWYENGQDLDFEKLIHLTQTLVTTGVMGFLGQNYFE